MRAGLRGLLALALSVSTADAAPWTGPCEAPRPPEGAWRLERGYGQGATESQAAEQAEGKARRQLVDSVAAPLTAQERAEVEARVDTTWQPTRVRPAAGGYEACAVAIVRMTDVSERLRRLNGELDAALRDRAAALAKALGPGEPLLRLSVPLWADGSAADVLGRELHLRWKGALGGMRVTDERGFTAEVRGELGRGGGDTCRLQLSWQRRGEKGWRTLEPVSFHPTAVGVSSCAPPPETAYSDARIGLEAGRHRGAGGLEVRLDTPPRDDLLCEGERFAVAAEASEPAWIRVYSVAEDGRVLLGWRSDAPVRRFAPDDPAIAVRLPGNQRDRIVAVAVPAKLGPEAFGGLPGAPACFGRGFDRRALPPEAAVDTLAHGVAPGGAGGCPGDAATLAAGEQIRAAIAAIPDCAR